MPLDLWLAFVAASTALLFIPGPTVLLVLSYMLSKGRAVALASAAPVAVGDFISLSTSLATLNALANALLASRLRRTVARPAVLVWITRAGGATLVGIGVLSASLRRSA